MPKDRTSPDFVIVIAILLLVTIGVIMVYSASAAYAHHNYGDSLYYAKRQLLFAAVGVFLMFLIAQADPKLFVRWAKPGLLLCFSCCWWC